MAEQQAQQRADKFCRSIRAIWDKKRPGSSIDLSSATITCPDRQNPIWRLMIGSKAITKHNTYLVRYVCGRCDREQVRTLNSLTKKINKGVDVGASCEGCAGLQGSGSGGSRSVAWELEQAKARFASMDDDFICTYFRKYLTESEYESVRHAIVSFGGGKFSDMSSYEYVPTSGVPGKLDAFVPVMYDSRRDVAETCTEFTMKCDGCSQAFHCHELFSHKNRARILCDGCKFTNDTIRYHYWDNCLGQELSYSNKTELNLIKHCNSHGIVLEPCPMQELRCGKRYRPSYYIPKLNTVIDVDNKLATWPQRAALLLQHCHAQGQRFCAVDRKTIMSVMKSICSDHEKI